MLTRVWIIGVGVGGVCVGGVGGGWGRGHHLPPLCSSYTTLAALFPPLSFILFFSYYFVFDFSSSYSTRLQFTCRRFNYL